MEQTSPAPRPAYRLVPSKFPPIGVFDTVSTTADMMHVLEVTGWTNDRLVAHRVGRLAPSELVFGVPNSSIIMAAFLHVGNDGMRFNSSDLGAWYAAATLNTAFVEVSHHLRRQAYAEHRPHLSRVYRAYSCDIAGQHVDLRGQQGRHGGLYDSGSYSASQAFGEGLRASNGHGVLYDSIRHRGGENICVLRPKLISNVTQTRHFRITVRPDSYEIRIKTLSK
ncbi:hypothetical protein GCM10019059_42800 [Camelimonas fluminis]|uniref:RES family NAD+ phosphorylase n=1 Tax=Camelimonas fluminis TaxID=1576911 RepID=A0ABV7UBG1_9HYPH|nr:RES family NAD+ phosphorylase [Camelimonas fluminis]GHE79769.1 hypothetical protein GCM10019059_42800 [Camelimonas fluminis]